MGLGPRLESIGEIGRDAFVNHTVFPDGIPREVAIGSLRLGTFTTYLCPPWYPAKSPPNMNNALMGVLKENNNTSKNHQNALTSEVLRY